jgi:WD40 repeat protein
MDAFCNAFISYGRADSKAFATKLHQTLLQQGLKVWFDQNDIPLAVDFQNQIDDGIAKSDNFLFIIAPHSVNSPYCRKEIELAIRLNKRIIPLLHVEEIDQATWQQRYPHQDAAQWQAYQAQGLHSSFPNMHPVISKINWVYFREGKDDFDRSTAGLLALFDRHSDYVRQHTCLLAKAQEWQRHQQQTRYLLVGEERAAAAVWLNVQFPDEQPPCEPTDLHCKFICESIKNANQLMTQVFISYDTTDKDIMVRLSKSLMRASITVWTNYTDIRTGEAFAAAICRGIEEADNLVYLISPSSLQSAYCQQEIADALSLNKRIIPLLVQPTDLEQIPPKLRSIQFINFTNQEAAAFNADFAKLLRVLREDAPYYEQHKILLTKALKWQRQNHNTSILLRGYNLRAAAAWLKLAQSRSQHPALSLQAEFIAQSLAQPESAAQEVFISYSRIDSDFARKLNDALQMQGKATWFDQESIASGSDFQQEIYRGIENSDNFLFVISPSSVNSPYCADEVEHAMRLNKRIVTVLHRAVAPASLHSGLASVQWIDFNQHNGDFYANFSELVRTLDTDRDHVRNHTKWSQRSLEWQQKGESADLLLRGTESAVAEQWLQVTEQQHKQPAATNLQKRFIQASSDAVRAEVRNQKRRIMLLRSLLALVSVALLVAIGQWRRAQVVQEGQIIALSRYSEALKTSHQELEAVVEGIRAARQLERQPVKASTRNHVIAALQAAVNDLKARNQFAGHEKGVTSASFSPDGQTIATASSDGTVKLWSLDGQELRTLRGHSASVNRVIFSPDGRTIATASDDYTAKLWSLNGQELQTLTGHTDWINDISFSPDGQTIATASRDQTIKLWSVAGQLLTTISGHKGAVYSVSFSADSQTIATGSYDATIRLWNLEGQELQRLTGHQGAVRSVRFSSDGQMLLSASEDSTAKLWSRDGQELHTLSGHETTLSRAVFSPDGQTIATASFDQTVKLWSISGQEIEVLEGHQNWVYDVSFSPDGPTLVTASEDQTMQLWNYDPPELVSLPGHADQVTSVQFSPDGQILTTASSDGTVKLWSRDGKELQTLTGHSNLVSNVSFSPDGQTLASASYDGTVKLWSRDGRELRTLQGTGQMTSVSFSPDGRMLTAGSTDRTVQLWNVDGEKLHTLTGHADTVSSVSFIPNGKTVSAELRGALIATGSYDRTVKLWSLDGKELQTLEHDSLVTDVRFSPDGQTIAAAVDNSTIVLWSADGQQSQVLEQPGTTTSVSFSPDSQMIATGGYEKTVTLWSRSGQKLQTLRGAQDLIYGVHFSPDSRAIVAASADRLAHVWTLNPEHLQNSIRLWQLDLKSLTAYGCTWIEDYLKYNARLEADDRQLCD